MPRTKRNTDFDAMVRPCYRRFSMNAEACINITRSGWNPTIEVVRRWVELCIPEGWSYRGISRLICLDAINIQHQELALGMLRVNESMFERQLEAMAGQAQGWRQRNRVATIVIPVQIGSTWLIYLTERHSLTQTVLRIAPGTQRLG